MPMIFAIHGGSGTPGGMIKMADFKPIADTPGRKATSI